MKWKLAVTLVTTLLSATMLLSTAAAGQDPSTNPISPDWFAMHVIQQGDPWPSTVGMPFSSWRSVSSSVKWSDINTSAGVYDWTSLDRWLSIVTQNHQTVLYTFYYTPSWASSCPTCTCNSGYQAPGGCYAPSDLNSDGTGSDKYLKDFVTALIKHVGPGKIQYIEVWNEPNNPNEYAGTIPQLVTMTKDVRTVAQSLDPNIKITSPPETGDGKGGLKITWLATYLQAGGGNYVDVIGIHGYVYNPEDIITRVSATTAVMSQYGQSGKPLWVTEGSWCCDHAPIPVANQPGFSFRLDLSMLSTPVSKFYLYAYDSGAEGNLWDQTKQKPTANATAYQLNYNWLVGATLSQPCKAQSSGISQAGVSSVWSCTFTKSGGYQAEAIWDASLSLGKSESVTVSNQYIQYRDVYGKVYKIQGHKVPIGYNPIWLENQS